MANLIQTNMQAIYLLSARGLCRVFRRTLQDDFAHYTNEDDLALKQAGTGCEVSQCAPELQPNHPMVSCQHTKGKDKSKLIRHQGKLCTSMHIPSSIPCVEMFGNTVQVKHRIWVLLAYTASPTTPASSQLGPYPASCSLGKERHSSSARRRISLLACRTQSMPSWIKRGT